MLKSEVFCWLKSVSVPFANGSLYGDGYEGSEDFRYES